MVKITTEELIAEVNKAQSRRENGAFTSQEYADSVGITQNTAQQHLKRLIREGKICFSGRVLIPTVDGRVGIVPSYKIISKKRSTSHGN